MENKIKTAADAIMQAYKSHTPCSPIRDILGDATLEDAYAAQELNTKVWLDQGRRLVGRKIGLTSKAVQKQLGVDQPDYGMLFADMALADGQEIDPKMLIQAKAEAEIAFIVGKDLPNVDTTMSELISAIEYALPAIEIVDSRVADWDIKIMDTIADNASSGLFALGTEKKKLSQVDLRLCGMVLELDNEPVSTGAGAACLGNPLNAALWLAQIMAKMKRPLQEGDIIMSGALGPMVTMNPGDVMEARIEGLGSVRAAMGNI